MLFSREPALSFRSPFEAINDYGGGEFYFRSNLNGYVYSIDIIIIIDFLKSYSSIALRHGDLVNLLHWRSNSCGVRSVIVVEGRLRPSLFRTDRTAGRFSEILFVNYNDYRPHDLRITLMLLLHRRGWCPLVFK